GLLETVNRRVTDRRRATDRHFLADDIDRPPIAAQVEIHRLVIAAPEYTAVSIRRLKPCTEVPVTVLPGIVEIPVCKHGNELLQRQARLAQRPETVDQVDFIPRVEGEPV